jgi:4-amino-4-deoxy-L-arabinose transferase-like glycosyltransferase
MSLARKTIQLGAQLRASGLTLGAQSLRKEVVASLILAAVLLIPRSFALDRVVTPDEKRWLAQSANFYKALSDWSLKDTYQIEHPGVPVMWIGVAAFLWRYPDYVTDSPGQFDWYRGEIAPLLRAQGHDVVALLAASRLLMALAITGLLVTTFWAARRLLGFWPALAGFLLIATDPFHIAHSRLLHLDGLSSCLMLLSLLTFLNHLYRGARRSDLLLSGVAAGLAGLTKSPALFLALFVGLWLLLELWARWRHQPKPARPEWAWAVRTLALWGAAGLVTFVLLWPAMWVDPLLTLWRVLRGAVGYAAEGHEDPLYFNGMVIDGDPGWLFYPVNFLWRTTPVILLGLGFLAAAWRAPAGLLAPAQRRPLAMLLLFALLFTAFMNLGAKKFDRYVLPIHPPLDLLAGLGWVAALGWLQQRLTHRRVRRAVPLVFALAVAAQAFSAAASHPYYLTYYNPLLGGTRAAPRVMMVGWGEGLDQAAAYLNRQPNAASLKVITGVWRGTFAYFFHGQVLDSSFAPGALTLQDWLASDYCVIYINQLQRRQLPGELLDYLAGIEPVHIVRLQNLDYVYIYDLHRHDPPAYLVEAASLDKNFAAAAAAGHGPSRR